MPSDPRIAGRRIAIDVEVAFLPPQCSGDADQITQELKGQIARGAREAGLVPVADKSHPHDVDVVVSLSNLTCFPPATTGKGEFRADFSTGGSLGPRWFSYGGSTPSPGEDKIARLILQTQAVTDGIAATRSPDGGGSSRAARARSSSVGGAAPPPDAVAGSPQPTAFALVVGIEKYRDVPAAQGAAEDRDRYKGLVQTTLGVPDDHVHVLADDRATKGDLEKELDWLQENVPSGGRAYFFYSGHGAPDTATGTPYLVPYDGDPKALARTAVPLSTVMNALQATKGKDALAVVDACFSGSGGRSVLPAGARPLVAVRDAKPTAKLALFTASTGAQISGPALDGKGGLFSQLVAEGLGSAKADMDEDGQVSLAELSQWVKPRVQREAKKDRRDQTPGLVLGAGAGRAEDFVVAYGVKR